MPFDADAYGNLTDRLGRCLQRLGLSRLTRDVTPTLREHLLNNPPTEEEP